MTPSRVHLVAIALLACAATGCQNPYDHKPRAQANGQTVVDPAQTVTPGPPARPVRRASATPQPSARATAKAFAVRWVNWDWRSVAAQQRALARLATGALGGQLQASARATRADASLRRDAPGVRGSVAAINLRTRGRRATGLVVTREQTYTAGRADLGGRRYRIYHIELVASPRGWQVSAWQPQP